MGKFKIGLMFFLSIVGWIVAIGFVGYACYWLFASGTVNWFAHHFF